MVAREDEVVRQIQNMDKKIQKLMNLLSSVKSDIDILCRYINDYYDLYK